MTTPTPDQGALERARLIEEVRDWHRIAKKKNEGMSVGFDTISALLSEIDATASEARAAAIEDVIAFILGGHFLHDDAPPKRFAEEVTREIRRALATPAQSPSPQTKEPE